MYPKPEWMIRKEKIIKESFNQATTAAVELGYRLHAREIEKKIANRPDAVKITPRSQAGLS